MSDIAIRVEGLGKQYRIGKRQASYGTLRDSVAETFVRPYRAARSLMTRNGNGHSLSASHLTSDFWALRDVSFDVRPGEVVGIIGRNGAGKSTLLKILSRITEPTLGGADICGRVGSLLEVGTGFHPELTGRENIYLNGSILGMKRTEIQKTFDEIVAFAEIEDFVDTPVKRYSSGMYIRLAFAVAAHMQTEILLVDEVLAVGDSQFQTKCLGKIGEVARKGRTVLFVTHNMAAVQRLCTSAILLAGGEIVSKGAVLLTIEEYLKFQSISRSDGLLAVSSDGKVELVAVEITNESGDCTSSVASGQDVTFKLKLRSQTDVGSIITSIGIEDIHGARVSLLANILVNASIKLSDPGNYVSCRVRELPLAPGNYTLSIKVTGPNGVLLWCPSIVELNVEGGDFYKSGKLLDASWVGVALIRHEWAVLPLIER